jgi:hypothetical protein
MAVAVVAHGVGEGAFEDAGRPVRTGLLFDVVEQTEFFLVIVRTLNLQL